MNTNDMQANPNLTEKQPVVVKKYSGLTLPAIVLLCLLIGVGGCKEEDLELLLLPDGGRQPSVLATNPNNDTVGLNSSEEIWVLFSDTMDQEKTQDAFRLSSGTGNVDGSYSWEGNRMVFQPRAAIRRRRIYHGRGSTIGIVLWRRFTGRSDRAILREFGYHPSAFRIFHARQRRYQRKHRHKHRIKFFRAD